MKNLLRNEIRLFINRRFFIALIFLVFAVFFLNQRTYLSSYDSYYPSMQNMYKAYLLPLESAQVRYEQEIKAYKKKAEASSEEEGEEIKEKILQLENMQEKYKDLSDLVKPLSLNLKQVQDQDFIDQQFILVDQYIEENFITAIKENGRENYYDGYGLFSDLDWANRIQERKWKEANGSNIQDIGPNASEAISYLLDGSNNYYYLISIGVLLFLNFDIWSKEFSSNEGKVILTLPYKRGKIFASRFVTRLLLSLFVLVLPLVLLFIFMAIKYKSGLGGAVVVSKTLGRWQLTNNFLIDAFNNLEFLKIHKLIYMWKFDLLLVALYSMWIVAIFSILSFLDLVFENGILTILGGLFVIFITLAAKSLSIFNIGTYTMQYNLLYGLERTSLFAYSPIKYTYEAYLLMTIFISLVLYLLGSLVLKRKRV